MENRKDGLSLRKVRRYCYKKVLEHPLGWLIRVCLWVEYTIEQNLAKAQEARRAAFAVGTRREPYQERRLLKLIRRSLDSLD